MRFKSIAVQPIAQFITQSINRDAQNAPHLQERILFANIAKAQQTKFGKEHNFAHIRTYADYKRQVPLRDYEQLKPYFDLFCQNIGYNIGHQIHTHHQRFYLQPL